MALESGVYRREVLARSFPDPAEHRQVLKILWSIFVFDRQFSFATGLPHCLRERDVDLPVPDQMEAPYIHAMTEYVKLGNHAWRQVITDKGEFVANPNDEGIEYLESELLKWQQALPVHLQPHQLPLMKFRVDHTEQDRIQRYVTTLLYLRANQLRLLVLRPLLFSKSRQTPQYHNRITQAVVVAADSVRVLGEMESGSDIYRSRQPIFNHFLASALAALFLYIANEMRVKTDAPTLATANSSKVLVAARESVARGFDVIRSLSDASSGSRRLQGSFAKLRELVTRLGLVSNGGETAGLAHASGVLHPDISEHMETLTWSLPDLDFSFLFDDSAATDSELLSSWAHDPISLNEDPNSVYSGIQDYAWMFQDF